MSSNEDKPAPLRTRLAPIGAFLVYFAKYTCYVSAFQFLFFFSFAIVDLIFTGKLIEWGRLVGALYEPGIRLLSLEPAKHDILGAFLCIPIVMALYAVPLGLAWALVASKSSKFAAR